DFGQINSTGIPANANIFINSTLFEAFGDIFNKTIRPWYNSFLPEGSPGMSPMPSFLPLNDTNRAKAMPTSLLQSYTCTQRQLKGWLSVLLSVVVADYTLTLGAYNLFILIARWL